MNRASLIELIEMRLFDGLRQHQVPASEAMKLVIGAFDDGTSLQLEMLNRCDSLFWFTFAKGLLNKKKRKKFAHFLKE